MFSMGLIIDQITEVFHVLEKDFAPPPSNISGTSADQLEGIIRIKGETGTDVIMSLNLPNILTEEELVYLEKLKNELNVYDVIPFSAATKFGIHQLKDSLENILNKNIVYNHNQMSIPDNIKKISSPLENIIREVFNISGNLLNSLSFRFLCNPKHIDKLSINFLDKKKIIDCIKNKKYYIST